MPSVDNEYLPLLSGDAGDPRVVEIRAALSGLGFRVASAPPGTAGVVVLLPAAAPPAALTDGSETGVAARSLALFTEGSWKPELANRFGDFLHWPCPSSELALRLERLSLPAAVVADDDDRQALAEVFLQYKLVGRSPAFLSVLDQLRKIARCNAPVLISGETGTGKELAARAIHYHGPRSGGPFIPVNSGALPQDLIENELFGHEKGAFTGAECRVGGLVEQARCGTLFLDEVDTLPARAQVALLRFLEGLEYRPLGGAAPLTADVRLIAAGSERLELLVDEGAFRRDLYFRLNLLAVHMPPLRDRSGDVRLLARAFAAECAAQFGLGDKALPETALSWLEAYRWPGNVRELKNLVQRAYLLADGDTFDIAQLLPGHPAYELDGARPQSFRDAKAVAIERFERCYLDSLMRRTAGNVTSAARLAGKERRALGRLLKKHCIDRHAYLRSGTP